MAFKYETLYGEKWRGVFSWRDFEPEESNRIITNLVRKIEQYEQNRVMETNYKKVKTFRGERIVSAKMKSKDGVIKGVITYEFPNDFAGPMARIKAEFNFNSRDESLKQEYLGLAKIISELYV